MFVITEADAARIRVACERGGELSAAVELRRLFPGIGDNAEARRCARTIAGWKPLALPLRPVTAAAHQGAVAAMRRAPPPPLPLQIGPVEFTEFDRHRVAVRCPADLVHIVQRVGAVWEPEMRRWLTQRKPIGPVIRAFEAATACRAGVSLD